jgi:hypothetical protein
MAEGVKVRVSDAAIIDILNTPGGAVFRWRDEIGKDIRNTAIRKSPENDPLNAVHRGEEVGSYKLGWRFNRIGSQGHTVRANVFNIEPHAVYVEYGRSGSTKMQIFSWTEWEGGIYRIGGPTVFDLSEERLPPRKRAWLEARNERIERTLPPKRGRQTHDRAGKYVLAQSVVSALGSVGISSITGV